jgi:hypothetical protein
MKRCLRGALVPFFSLTALAAADSVHPGDVVAHFGSVPVFAEEMVLHLRDQVALVAVHFTRTYGAHLSGEDWLATYEGERPVDRLREQALDACREAKAIQGLAADHGMGEPLPFPGLAAHCDRLNRARAAARADGRILYGVLAYSPDQYYKHILSTMRNRLRDTVFDGSYEERERALRRALATRREDMPVTVVARNLDRLVAGQVGVD